MLEIRCMFVPQVQEVLCAHLANHGLCHPDLFVSLMSIRFYQEHNLPTHFRIFLQPF